MFRRPFIFFLLLSFIISFSCSENHKSVDNSNHRTSKYGSNTDEKFDDPDEFIKLFAEIREGYTYGYRERELEIMKKRLRTSAGPDPENPAYGTSAAAAATFTERGPRNVAGRTRAILIDAADASGNTWIAGSVGGGVWKTSDQGSTWTNLSSDMENIAVTTLAQSAIKPQILYAGTGEGWVGNLDAIDGSGVFKSTDGGLTWINITPLSGTELNLDFSKVSRAVVDPTNANILVVSTSDKIYRTSDGGTTWSQVYDGLGTVMHVIATKSDFNIQYAAVRNEGIIKSTDGGLTWSATASFPVNSNARIEIAASRTDPNKVYAGVAGGGLVVTNDGGTTWKTIPDNTGWLSGQGWYDNIITVNPYVDTIIYVGGIDLWKFTVNFSTNTKTDTRISDAYNGSINGFGWTSGVHPDQQFIDVIDDGGGNFRLLVGNDGGVDVSVSNSDPGTTNGDFTVSDIGYNTTQFYGADKVKGYHQYIAGAQDNGTWLSDRSEVASSSSDYSFEIGGDGFEVIAHWTDPDKMIGGSQYNSFRRTTDGGSSWIYYKYLMTGNHQFVSSVATSYQDPEVVYHVTSDGIWRSLDFAQSFNLAPPSGGSWGYNSMSDVEVSLANPRYVWAGGWGDLYLSSDHGASFNSLPSYLTSKSGSLRGIYSHPTEDSTVYVLFSNRDRAKIIETKDLGQTWSDITGFVSGTSTRGFPDVPTYSLAVMPYDTDVIWAGTDIGLVESTDRGLTWNLVQSTLPHVSIWDLKVKDQCEVVLSTHGRGVWTANVPDLCSWSPKSISGLALDMINVVQNAPKVDASFNLRSNYDSMIIEVDGVKHTTFKTGLVVGSKTLSIDLSTQGTYEIQGIGYIDGDPLHSNIKTITIREVLPAQPFYATDFSDGGLDFSLDGFVVRTETGFDNEHLINNNIPYDLKTTYIAELNVPIKVVYYSPSISFKEVALVEPGDNSGFWDYVTVEATSDNGLTWVMLVDDVYDARAHADWLSAYNANSNGTSALYKDREVDFAPHFNVGDTVRVRFKFYSDDYVAGWGWAIDDLSIQVLDNHPPEIDDQTFNDPGIDENSSNGTLVGLVSATDKDGDDLTFSITGGSGENTFSIDNDGNLTVSDNTKLDYEANTSLDLTVVVSDGLASDDATITININDVFEKSKVHITASNNNFNGLNSISMNEADGGGNNVIITAHVDEPLPQNVSISVAWSGSATYGGDYNLMFPYIDPSVLIIPADVDSVKYFTISPINDEVYEGGIDGESIILDIDDISSPYVEEAGESQVTITITDGDDYPWIYFGSDNMSGSSLTLLDQINEGESTEYWAEIGYGKTSDEDIYIDVAYGGLAVKDFDYTSSSQRLTIPSGATESDKITINALMDNDSGEDDSENIIVNYEILGSNTTWTDHGSHGYPVPDSYQIYILDMTPLGVERIYGINKIYPIPADRVVKVDLQDNVNVEKVEFIDFLGKVYNNTKFTKNLNTVLINVSDYDAGVYILNIQTNKGLTKAKVIIER